MTRGLGDGETVRKKTRCEDSINWVSHNIISLYKPYFLNPTLVERQIKENNNLIILVKRD